MKKIGIIFGMENTFPPALVERINSMKVEGVAAEFVKIGAVKIKPASWKDMFFPEVHNLSGS